MSYVEVIYIDDEQQACRKTGLSYEWETPEATWAAFRQVKAAHDIGSKGTYWLDYYNRKGDLSDSIGITPEAFTAITGERVQSVEHYRQVDRDFWTGIKADIARKEPKP